MKFTDEQTAAMISKADDVVVVAGAGTGKTTTLVGRAYHLMNSGVPHDQLLILTFSRHAAMEIQDRLDRLIGILPEVMTIHGWCARTLRQNGGLVRRSSSFSVYDQRESDDLVRRCAVSVGRTVTPRSRLSAMRRDEKVMTLYRSRCDRSDALDLDSIERMTEALLRGGRLAAWVHGRYHTVLVDEAQDLSELQWSIIFRMAPRLFAVGDPRQCIYTFRGARPEIFEHLAGGAKPWECGVTLDVPHREIVRMDLTVNHRSCGAIVGAANTVGVRWPSLEAGRPEKGGLRLMSVDSEQGVSVAELVTAHVAVQAAKRAPGSVAVIAQTWDELRSIGDLLDTLGIPAIHHGPEWDPWERTPAGRQLARCLQLYLNCLDDHLALEVANWGDPERFSEHELALMGVEAIRERESLRDILCEHSSEWQRVALALAGLPDHDPAMASAHEVASCFSLLLNKEARNEVEPLMVQLVEDHLTLGDWHAWWVFGRREVRREQLMTSDAVHLMTGHASKGMEWPVVYVVGLERWPRWGDWKEARRLLYVAMTRARDELVLVSDGDICEIASMVVSDE